MFDYSKVDVLPVSDSFLVLLKVAAFDVKI